MFLAFNINMSFYITDGINNISISNDNCIPLELLFNKSKQGINWKFIGDHLYYYIYPSKEYKYDNILKVSSEQYKFLELLIKNNNFNIE